MAFDYNGTWYNQLGAKFEAKVSDKGEVKGLFTSPVQPDKPVETAGYVQGDLIVFCNAFEGGAGTMIGQPLDPDSEKEEFETWWHFRAINDPKPAWATVRTGCDTFRRTPPKG